jgi:flavin-dependent dehydrogenase
MGVLERVAAAAHAARQFRFHAPNGATSSTPVPKVAGAPEEVLVVPRSVLDAILVTRAIEAGARFQVAKVAGLVHEAGAVRGVRLVDGTRLSSDLVVLATGAALPLVREAGLAPARPAMLVAARRYFSGIRGLRAGLEFLFDGVALPGYAWLFPVGAERANVGLGWTRAIRGAPRAGLDRLVRAHASLARTLDGATPEDPARGCPLRVDFLRSRTSAAGVLAAGEAAGLVNPVTGEGIDYALESGRVAAEAILEAGGDPARAGRRYDASVASRFRTLFRVLTLSERIYYNGPGLNRFFGGNPGRQRLVDLLVDVCFGAADPKRLLSPRTLFQVLRP